MTIRELFDKLRLLPDWNADVKISEGGVFSIDSVSVGEITGDVYISVGHLERKNLEEFTDEI